MKRAAFPLSSWLVIYALAFGALYVSSGRNTPRSLAIWCVVVVLASLVRVRLQPDLKTNDPDIRPHYREDTP